MSDFDLAIVGSGFGGSLLAMIARRLGLRVILLERGRHPRFAIGESASPLAGIVIEQLADRYDLPRVRPLSAFGTWQRAYPEVVCGLKRGFTYFRHEAGQPYRTAGGRANQLLVAASPDDEQSDTHWLRSDVDAFLVGEAIALGAEYVDEVSLERMDANGGVTLSGTRRGREVAVSAAFAVDASGPRGFLSRALRIADRGFAGYPGTQALFSHFTGVARCDEMPDFGPHPPHVPHSPYPPDDAALHHVFDGGWMWVLRFGNGVTSAGIAVTDALAADLRLADGEPAWRRFLDRYPSIAAQFSHAVAIREFTCMPRLSWRASSAAGPRWAMLPSAAAFIDPLFSTGIPLTLLGIERIGRILEGGSTPNFQLPTPKNPEPLGVGGWGLGVSSWREYETLTLAEADHAADFIAGCYAAFPRFEDFASYSMFYFAAASYGELARRERRADAPRRFLAADREPFATATAELSPSRTSLRGRAYHDAVAAAVAPLNIAGLCDRVKANWYPFIGSGIVQHS